MDAVCRVCLVDEKFLDNGELFSIFAVDSENVHLSSKIMKCSNKIMIEVGDNFPSHICANCTKILDIAYKFIQQCEESDATLRSHYLIKENTQPNDDSIGCDERIAKEEGVEIESEQGYSENEEKYKPAVKNIIKYSKKAYIYGTEEKKRKTKNSSTGQKKKERISKSAKKLKKEEEDVKIKLENVYDDYEDIPLKSLSAVALSPQMKPKRSRGRPKKVDGQNLQPIANKKPKRLLVCERCGKSFKHLVSLRGHERRHTGEKPFMCSTCGKTFHVPNELRKHSIIHTGVKPYKCTFCDRTFVDWGSRLKHERCHLGERPYKCDQCSKAFSYSYVLAKHKLTHTGIKAFICEICKKTFRLKYHLTNHCRKHHGTANLAESEGDLQIVEDHYKNHYGADYEKHCRKQKVILAYKNLHGKACQVVMDV